MSKPILSVEGLSKRYLLGQRGDGNQGLRHVLNAALTSPFRKLFGSAARRELPVEKEAANEFWALRDLDFAVQQGEVVGVIGRNGAGKSTLLKILSRITEPTHGRVTIRGRVASLLEVGTGFHPELTGRENIFLNGAILGMSRQEIRLKMDEIVAFAEVERFLDTPVKRYSSGMYVRLAFAVAAHLEPEILVVDEVLAVGDGAFQKKCLGKMGQVARTEGRTIFFVSHNIGAISSLTSKVLYLRQGRVEAFSPTAQAVQRYLGDTHLKGASWKAPKRSTHPLQILSVQLLTLAGQPTSDCEAGEGFFIELEYEVRTPLRHAIVEVYIHAADGTHLVTLGDHDCDPDRLLSRQAGLFRVRIRIPGDWLNLGTYFLQINSGTTSLVTFDYAETITFNLVENTGRSSRNQRRGHLVPMLPWEVVRSSELGAEPLKAGLQH